MNKTEEEESFKGKDLELGLDISSFLYYAY